MPELPDVEIERRRLQRWLVGATVSDADCNDARLTRPLPPRAFARKVVGKTVEAVVRKGKWLRLDLDDGTRVFSHLGMTGGWVQVAVGAPSRRFERARIDVARRRRKASLRYADARRFGRLIASREDIADWTALGPDPLSDGIDVRRLSEALARRQRAVKDLLMDQRVLAGVGNILATEALWLARIDPRSPGDALLFADARAIASGIRRAIARELADQNGYAGDRTGSFFVYGRAGELCPRCGTRLSSVVLGGRTTVFCSHCQVRRRKRSVWEHHARGTPL
jgi:formamidopyrimidine-DNA glycosylase